MRAKEEDDEAKKTGNASSSSVETATSHNLINFRLIDADHSAWIAEGGGRFKQSGKSKCQFRLQNAIDLIKPTNDVIVAWQFFSLKETKKKYLCRNGFSFDFQSWIENDWRRTEINQIKSLNFQFDSIRFFDQFSIFNFPFLNERK